MWYRHPGDLEGMGNGVRVGLLGRLNVVGGVVGTDRMLEMFRKKK